MPLRKALALDRRRRRDCGRSVLRRIRFLQLGRARISWRPKSRDWPATGGSLGRSTGWAGRAVRHDRATSLGHRQRRHLAHLARCRLDIDPAGLLVEKLRIRLLRAGAWDQARPPSGPAPSLAESSPNAAPAVWHRVDRLEIDRLLLAPPVLGTSVIATLVGDLAFRRAAANATLDIHRIDGAPGNIALQLTLTGEEPILRLRLHANDPTGLIDDRVFGRTDHLPLTLSIDGNGLFANWHGRLAFSAGLRRALTPILPSRYPLRRHWTYRHRARVAAFLSPASRVPCR